MKRVSIPKRKEKRLGKVSIHFSLLTEILKGNFPIARVEGLPKDAKIVRVFQHPDRVDTLEVILTSKEFPLVAEGFEMVSYTPVYHRISRTN